MKENYNLVKSCQDTRKQLRTELASQERDMGESEGQRPGYSPDSFLGPGLLGRPWPEGNHNLRNGLFGRVFSYKPVQS